MTSKLKYLKWVVFFILFFVTAYSAQSDNVSGFDDVIDQSAKRSDKAEAYQMAINQIDDDTKKIEKDYRATLKEIDGLSIYIEQLHKQLANQNEEIDLIAKSIKEVTLIERQITPLILRMIDSIGQFVKLDLPFRQELRSSRISKLKQLITRADLSIAEKYRHVLDVYLKEIEYGRTIEAYRGVLIQGVIEKDVDFLRVGRISLMYQSLDGEEVGVWNKETRSWHKLADGYKRKIKNAIKIADKNIAPDLIKVPVSSPVLFKKKQSINNDNTKG